MLDRVDAQHWRRNQSMGIAVRLCLGDFVLPALVSSKFQSEFSAETDKRLANVIRSFARPVPMAHGSHPRQGGPGGVSILARLLAGT